MKAILQINGQDENQIYFDVLSNEFNSIVTIEKQTDNSFVINGFGDMSENDVVINSTCFRAHKDVRFDKEFVRLFTYDDNGVNNDSFTYGGIIIIEKLNNDIYTPYELSKLNHAMSILYGSGSEKLIALANEIGAPLPKPH